MNKDQWRKHYEEACDCFDELKRLAESSIDDEVDATEALHHWSTLMSDLNIKNLNTDPSFTEPFFEQLQAMNEELLRIYIARRDSIGQALNKQKKTHASIKAYQNS